MRWLAFLLLAACGASLRPAVVAHDERTVERLAGHDLAVVTGLRSSDEMFDLAFAAEGWRAAFLDRTKLAIAPGVHTIFYRTAVLTLVTHKLVFADERSPAHAACFRGKKGSFCVLVPLVAMDAAGLVRRLRGEMGEERWTVIEPGAK